MKSRKRKIGDVGIRLKPIESNILENYSKYRKRVKRTKKKKKKKPKTVKNIEIIEKTDLLSDNIEEKSETNDSQELELKEKPKETKIVHVDNKPKDLSETDPNVKKTLTITASLKPDKNKEGSGILIE